MIAANVEAAKFLDKRKIPALYRVHAPPPESKYEDLLEFLREFGLQACRRMRRSRRRIFPPC